MAVSYILEDVNNFMQMFEPALCDIDKRAQVLDTWSVFTSQNIFIHRMAIGWVFSVFGSFIYGICKVFLTFVCSRLTVTNYKLSKQLDFAE